MDQKTVTVAGMSLGGLDQVSVPQVPLQDYGAPKYAPK